MEPEPAAFWLPVRHISLILNSYKESLQKGIS